MSKLGKPITEHFEENGETKYQVPRFQRGFSWEKSQVTDFLKDIDERITDRKDHFLGPIFLLYLVSIYLLVLIYLLKK